MLKCGVIGVGYMGQFHAEKYAALANAELVGIYDVNLERAEQLAKTLQCTAFSDYYALLDQVDAVSIAVPTQYHYPVALECLNHAIHVLLEKPIATTLSQANQLIRAAKKNNRILQIGHLEHFNPVFQAAKPYINQPRFIEALRISPFKPRNTDVDVILDLMIHDLELIQYLVAAKIKHISASGACIITDKTDIANVRITFENGCVANLTASRISTKSERILRVFQQNAYLHVNFQQRKLIVHQKNKNDINVTDCPIPEEDALSAEIKAFLQAISQGLQPEVSGQEGKQALSTSLKIHRLLQQSFVSTPV